MWNMYRNTISWQKFKPDLDPTQFSEEVRKKTFDFRPLSEYVRSFEDDQKTVAIFNTALYDQAFAHVLGRLPQIIISAFGPYDFHWTWPLHLTTNYPKNESVEGKRNISILEF